PEVRLRARRVAAEPSRLAEAEPAVGGQRAHVELGRQGQRAQEALARTLRVRAPGPERDLAEEPERPSRVPALAVLLGDGEALLGELEGPCETTVEHGRFAERREGQGMGTQEPH